MDNNEMLVDLIQWGLGMTFVIGLVMFLWGLANHQAEKKYQLHERLTELEQWKAGEELRQAHDRRTRKAKREIASRERRLQRDRIRWQNELAADLNRGDGFDQALKEMLDGNR